jgi:hypothetical protein
MSATVKAAIAAEIALVDRIVDPPTGDLGWGSDISCATDLDEAASELPGTSPLILAQACIRRLDCGRGELPDDPSYGLDVRAMVNEGMPAIRLREIEGQIRGELEKDERIERIVAVVTASNLGRDLTIDIQGTGISGETFRLTLAATNASLLVEEIAA